MKTLNNLFLKVIIILFIYLGIALNVFEYRHPKANRWACVRNIKSACLFEEVESLK